jgi:hypothetical protein
MVATNAARSVAQSEATSAAATDEATAQPQKAYVLRVCVVGKEPQPVLVGRLAEPKPREHTGPRADGIVRIARVEEIGTFGVSPSPEEHAMEFLRALQGQPHLAGQWVPTKDIQTAYYRFCDDIGWNHRSWLGRNGVAYYLAKLTEKRYRRVEIRFTEDANLMCYLIPEPAAEEG